jgi:hypothetical protein
MSFFSKNLLFSIKMEEYESLQDHLLKITATRDQLKAIDIKVEEDYMVIIMIKSQQPAYENFVENSKFITKPKLIT